MMCDRKRGQEVNVESVRQWETGLKDGQQDGGTKVVMEIKREANKKRPK